MAKKDDFQVLELTVPKIKDFQLCERYYDYKHNNIPKKVKRSRIELQERFDETLKRVISFFFYKRQAGITPSYSALLHRWERLWFPKDMTGYDISTEQHEIIAGNLASFSTEASIALMKFHEDFSDHPGMPMIIDEDYSLVVKREVRLRGSIDLVLRTGDIYQVYKWYTRKKSPSQSSIILDLAAVKMAFEHKMEGRAKKVRYGIYDLVVTKPGYFPVDVSEADVQGLLYWINNIYEEKVFPNRRGLTSHCKVCEYDLPCKKWTMPRLD